MDTPGPLYPSTYAATERIILDRSARLGIVGLDYEGLDLAISFSRAGFVVEGFDADPGRVAMLRSRKSYLSRISSAQIMEATNRGFQAREDLSCLSEADVIILCIRPELDNDRHANWQSLRQTTFEVAEFLRAGQLVVVESTAYPGPAEQIVMPILEKANSAHLRVSRDTGMWDEIFLAISPRRIGPLRTAQAATKLPKFIAGIDHFSLALAAELYGTCSAPLVIVSSASTAQLIDVFKSTYKTVNTALANELKQVCLRMGIDQWEVIEAVSACLCGPQVFYAGPGLRVSHIPSDSCLMSRKPRLVGVSARLVELAQILVLGVASEKNADDLLGPPSLTLLELLRNAEALVSTPAILSQFWSE